LRVARVVEQQVEQGRQVARVRAQRQVLAAQALAQFVQKRCPRRKAVVGQQGRHVDVTPEGGQQGHHAGTPRRVGIEQAHHVLGATHGLAPADPVEQANEPDVAFGQHGARVGLVQQGLDIEAIARTGPPGASAQGLKQSGRQGHQCRDWDRASVNGAIGASKTCASSVMQ
jgi:hypothetical protein